MAKLFFLLDGKTLGEFSLNKERMTIGRRPTNDIHIDDLAVSGEHAMILTLGPDSFLEDMNSTNGTMVNKKAVKKHVLQHNDVIEFGKYKLQYIVENQIKKTNTDSLGQLMQSKAYLPEGSDQRSVPSQSAISEEVNIDANAQIDTADIPSQNLVSTSGAEHLLILNGSNAGQSLSLNSTMLKLGTIGEQLALITRRPQGYYLSHVIGEDRPMVNGRPISVMAFKLSNQDVIEISGIRMEVILA